MIIAKKKPSSILFAYIALMLGLVVSIFLFANAKPKILLEKPVIFSFISILLVSVFYVLPIYGIIAKREITIDNWVLNVKGSPLRGKKYSLKELVEWQLKEGYSRYGSTTHLYLVFSNKETLKIFEKDMTNFDILVKCFNSNFRKLRKTK